MPRPTLAALMLLPACAVATAQEVDRDRVKSEAAAQSSEADRRFKAGEFAEAIPLYEAERESRKALGDLRYEAYAARAIGSCRANLGEFEAAVAAYREAIPIDEARDDPGYVGFDWLLIGKAQHRSGQPGEAVESLRRALPKLNRGVDRDHEADARLILARCLADLGRRDEARPHVDRALELSAALDDPRRRAEARGEAGRLAYLSGDAALAADWLSQARDGHLALAEPSAADAAAMDRMLADALIDLGHARAAACRAEAALAAHESLGDPSSAADDLGWLASARLDAGDAAGALPLAARAVDRRREAGDPDAERAALVLLAHCQGRAGTWAASSRTLVDVLDLAADDGPDGRVPLLLLASDVARRARLSDRSSAYLDEAARSAAASKDSALIRAVAEARRSGP